MAEINLYMYSYYSILNVFIIIVCFSEAPEAINICRTAQSTDRGLTVFRNHCFLFQSEENTWIAASLACNHKGGNLVAISDEATQHFVVSKMRELRWQTAWIGANDRRTEGQWVWTTGIDVGYSNWGSYYRRKRFLMDTLHDIQNTFNTLKNKARDTLLKIPNQMEDCAYVKLSDRGRWHDAPCSFPSFRFHYICQFDTIQTASSTAASIMTKSIISSASNKEWSPGSTTPSSNTTSSSGESLHQTVYYPSATGASPSSPGPTVEHVSAQTSSTHRNSQRSWYSSTNDTTRHTSPTSSFHKDSDLEQTVSERSSPGPTVEQTSSTHRNSQEAWYSSTNDTSRHTSPTPSFHKGSDLEQTVSEHSFTLKGTSTSLVTPSQQQSQSWQSHIVETIASLLPETNIVSSPTPSYSTKERTDVLPKLSTHTAAWPFVSWSLLTNKPTNKAGHDKEKTSTWGRSHFHSVMSSIYTLAPTGKSSSRQHPSSVKSSAVTSLSSRRETTSDGESKHVTSVSEMTNGFSQTEKQRPTSTFTTELLSRFSITPTSMIGKSQSVVARTESSQSVKEQNEKKSLTTIHVGLAVNPEHTSVPDILRQNVSMSTIMAVLDKNHRHSDFEESKTFFTTEIKIGLSVGAVIALVLAIVLLIIFKRRRPNKERDYETMAFDNEFYGTVDKVGDSVNSLYANVTPRIVINESCT